MNKSELIDAIAEKSGLTKIDSAKALDATLAAVTQALTAGDSVTLVGFGTFSVKDRPERQGFNPKTKEPLIIAASKSAVFKAGKGLKDAVDGKEVETKPKAKSAPAKKATEAKEKAEPKKAVKKKK